jgi:hypothetical protein
VRFMLVCLCPTLVACLFVPLAVMLEIPCGRLTADMTESSSFYDVTLGPRRYMYS